MEGEGGQHLKYMTASKSQGKLQELMLLTKTTFGPRFNISKLMCHSLLVYPTIIIIVFPEQITQLSNIIIQKIFFTKKFIFKTHINVIYFASFGYVFSLLYKRYLVEYHISTAAVGSKNIQHRRSVVNRSARTDGTDLTEQTHFKKRTNSTYCGKTDPLLYIGIITL